MRAVGEAGYRGPQVCEIVGITYRQLDYWARTDLLRPSLADARGSGTQRLYSYRDLLELKVIKQLLDAGLNLREARRAVECLRRSGDELATANLVLGAAGTVLANTDEQIVDLLKGGQGVFNILPLANVVGDIDAAIVKLTPDAAAEAAAGTAAAGTAAGNAAAAGGGELRRAARRA